MITQETCYVAVCDGCGEPPESDYGAAHFASQSEAIQDALDADWTQHEGALFCQGCVEDLPDVPVDPALAAALSEPVETREAAR